MKQNNFFSTPRRLIAALVFAFLIALTPMTTQADAPPRGPSLYVVEYGDSLESIAAQFGVSVETILQVNGMTSPHIYVGRQLSIPSGYTPSAYGATSVYIVQPGDTLFSIARRHGVSPYVLLRLNRLFNPNFIFAGMRLLIPRVSAPPPYATHIVRFGDTLSSIAFHFGTSIYALMLANHIPNPNLIFAGMRLVIPRGAYTPPPSGYPTVAPMTPGPSPIPGSGGIFSVALRNIAFTPRAITIRVGTKVVWTNGETSNIPHTVTSGAVGAPSGTFESGNLNPGSSFQFTFNSGGTFNYYCRIHGAAMTGVVTVTP